jgi:hypothetical protein
MRRRNISGRRSELISQCRRSVDPGQNQYCQNRFVNYPGISFVLVDELRRQTHRGSYHLVTCMEVLEHCIAATAEKVIADVRQMVAKDGVALISVPIEIGPTLIGKHIVRTIAGWRSIGDYKYNEKYSFAELATMLLANDKTAIKRPTYSGQDGVPYHGHKGFNWRSLRARLDHDFEIKETRFSPLEFLHGFASSQAWFVCIPR